MDGKALAAYRETYSRYRQAADHIGTNDMLNDKGRLSPYVKVIESCQNQLYRWLVECRLHAGRSGTHEGSTKGKAKGEQSGQAF